MKQWMKWVGVGLVALVLAACGSGDEASDDVLRVGTEGTYAPFSFHGDGGELTGYDVDVIREVAKRMGRDVEFFETQWDGMFAGLDAERFDVIANQVGINEEREAAYAFTTPYTHSEAVLLVKEGSPIDSFEAMDGEKASQTLTSNFGELAKSYGATLEQVEGFNQAIDLVTSGRVAGTFNDKISALDFLKQRPDAPVEMVEGDGEGASDSAFLVRKGDEALIEQMNEALEAMRDDGTLVELSERWFGADVTK